MSRPLHIGIIAGEPSGDVLAAGLIRAIQAKHSNVRFSGIGGQHMLAAGFHSIVDMETLSVMGLVEVLSRLPELVGVKRAVLTHFADDKPDVFIGVDAPDFNLRIEKVLKQRGIPTIHYVSPTVWAWREKRIHTIAEATDLVLGLFPFEAPIYAQYKVPYRFVGHTLADTIPLYPDQKNAREQFSLDTQQPVLALLPGSRRGEVAALLDSFLQAATIAASKLTQGEAALTVLIPAANAARREQIEATIGQYSDSALAIQVIDGQSRECLIAADAVLIASGTATLEAMLCKRPMVVAYKMAKMTHFLMSYLYKPAYFSLPNLLADAPLVTELLQQDVNAETLATHLIPLFGDKGQQLEQRFIEIHQSLKLNADSQAADAVLGLVTC
ncbi:lipid-A-disaccharide synthase [Alteromonas oceanisediminis]|uniref:lipid-A-disaccharide synthase n=1 Tax=Alteromonas oceanisediminis TaxID=2836180 RepID=UPI001BD914F1|nr:lipid-A-disaccharide synthase [Alteromonas oceanisediminis]MBT0585002.1 lipid-A-disaccharide synthase [Alteromonas oceanisediminis]